MTRYVAVGGTTVKVSGNPDRRKAGDVSFIDYVYEPYFIIAPKSSQLKTWEDMCGKKVAIIQSTADAYMIIVNKFNEAICAKAGRPQMVGPPVENGSAAMLDMKQGRVDSYMAGALSWHP